MKKMKRRTWPVFLLGLGSLLALLFVPGITAIQQTQNLHQQFRAIQQQYEANAQRLQELGNRMFANSVLIREFLLDSSPTSNAAYRERFEQNREAVERLSRELSQTLRPEDRITIDRLEEKLAQYWKPREDVLEWTPAERNARSTYYLREMQTLRRESIMELAGEISRLNRSNFLQQMENIERSQRDVSESMKHSMWLAFALGLLVTGGSVARIWLLERGAREHNQRLERLSADLMHAQEEERRMISRELHDEVGQMVTGLKMELAALDRLRDSDPDEFRTHLNEARSLADQTLKTVRNLAVGLRPSVLELGLVPAVDWLARDISSRSGLNVRVTTTGELEKLPEKHRVCIYRVVQEALNNCVKHAQAQSVEVLIRGEGSMVQIEVRDDGVGLTEKRSAGIGLIGIEERIRELGGIVEIHGSPGEGTRLKAAVSVA